MSTYLSTLKTENRLNQYNQNMSHLKLKIQIQISFIHGASYAPHQVWTI
ncbi:unnamed protein product [Musa hybrid cultivar]